MSEEAFKPFMAYRILNQFEYLDETGTTCDEEKAKVKIHYINSPVYVIGKPNGYYQVRNLGCFNSGHIELVIEEQITTGHLKCSIKYEVVEYAPEYEVNPEVLLRESLVQFRDDISEKASKYFDKASIQMEKSDESKYIFAADELRSQAEKVNKLLYPEKY